MCFSARDMLILFGASSNFTLNTNMKMRLVLLNCESLMGNEYVGVSNL